MKGDKTTNLNAFRADANPEELATIKSVFKSTAMSARDAARITRRANQLVGLDHGDLAVVCARLENAARRLLDEVHPMAHAELRRSVESINALLK